LLTCTFQHPVADLYDHAVFFGQMTQALM